MEVATAMTPMMVQDSRPSRTNKGRKLRYRDGLINRLPLRLHRRHLPTHRHTRLPSRINPHSRIRPPTCTRITKLGHREDPITGLTHAVVDTIQSLTTTLLVRDTADLVEIADRNPHHTIRFFRPRRLPAPVLRPLVVRFTHK